MTQDTLTTFFGWMTVLNLGFLTLTTVALFALQDWATGLHAKLFDMDPVEVRNGYFRYLSQYKVLTFVLALVPYIALKLT